MEIQSLNNPGKDPRKHVLGLICSPRQYGNCEIYTKEVFRNLKGEYDLRLIRLTSLNIEPCKGCYGCILDKPCPRQDDMKFLLEEIAAADAILIASPVYYLGANAAVKKVLDRGFLFFTALRQTYGKPAILLNFYGIKDRIGVAPQMLHTMAAMLGLNVKASVNIRAALPGESVLNSTHLKKAKRLADTLFSSKSMQTTYGCPYCGCEIVRTVKEGFFCTVCHALLKSDGTTKLIGIKKGPVLGPLNHLMLHKKWLAGMKDLFLMKRKEIMRAVIPYKEIGEWIEPPK